jgi:hypothetical protein
MHLSITNSSLVAIEAAKRILEHLLDYKHDHEINRINLMAPDSPFGKGRFMDFFVELIFTQKQDRRYYGKVEIWVLIEKGGESGAREWWVANKGRVISVNHDNLGLGNTFRLDDQFGVIFEIDTEAAEVHWKEAKRRRMDYTIKVRREKKK